MDGECKTVRELQAEGVLLVEDGNHGENRPRPDDFEAKGTYFVRAADLSGGRIDFARCEQINQVALERIRKGIGRPQDIILSHKGTVGKLARADENAPPFVCSPQTTFWRVLKSEKLNRDYLYAYMRSSSFGGQLKAVQGETDMAPYVSLTAQRRLLIPIPGMVQQKAIGGLLGALHDKIELNRSMAETLEATARALFKSWFVDFDPVHAKVDASLNRLPDEVTALFPARLTDDGLPEGWEFRRLGDLIELAYGKALPKEVRRPGHIPVYGSGGENGFHDELLVSGPGIVVGRKGTVGSLFWVSTDFYPIDTVFYVKARRNESLDYLWQLLQRLGLGAMNTDAAVPGLNRENAYRLAVIDPGPALVQAFTSRAEVIRGRRESLLSESTTLSALHDALLPKLISGELRIREAEHAVMAVA